MANIILTRPQAGQHTVLDSVPDSRLVLQFPTSQATMERAGDNLIFSFDDGSSIELSDFYTQYSQESMPDFEVDGTLVAGTDFFNAFGPDLMPAAGPGAAARAAVTMSSATAISMTALTIWTAWITAWLSTRKPPKNLNAAASVWRRRGGFMACPSNP